MANIAQRDVTKNLFALLKETFEGPGGNTYLDNGAGLFQTLDALTAKGASHVPYVGAQTIAGHCAHLTYYMRVNHDGMMGREERLDWPASWRPQQERLELISGDPAAGESLAQSSASVSGFCSAPLANPSTDRLVTAPRPSRADAAATSHS